MSKTIIVITLTCLAAWALAAEPITGFVDYEQGGVKLHGYFARPAQPPAGGAPGVLVVHEWWGMNDYAQRRARELAEKGYVAFACDMYGGGQTTNDFKQAAEWAGEFYKDREKFRARGRAGLAQLKAQSGVDATKLAAIGFCFGGTTVLELARAGEPLAAVVSFHGGLSTTTEVAPGAIKARVLALHGGADTFVKPADVAGFMEEMTKAGATWRMEVYGGAVHAFTNAAIGTDVSKGIAYNPEAERRSFAAMQALFDEVFAAKN